MMQNPLNPDSTDSPNQGLPNQGSPSQSSPNPDPASPNLASALAGMSAAAAKEYIFGFVATLKLTEKEILALEEDAAKWKGRVDMARSRGIADLLAGAEKEEERINTRLGTLREEARELKDSIDSMRRQLPGVAARERNIDPDILEQELLMALGRTGEEAETDRAFSRLEKEDAAEAALEALKAKMKG